MAAGLDAILSQTPRTSLHAHKCSNRGLGFRITSQRHATTKQPEGRDHRFPLPFCKINVYSLEDVVHTTREHTLQVGIRFPNFPLYISLADVVKGAKVRKLYLGTDLKH